MRFSDAALTADRSGPAVGPATCRLNLHHRWRWLSTEDGDRFERCEKCGKDRSDKVGGSPEAGLGIGGI